MSGCFFALNLGYGWAGAHILAFDDLNPKLVV